MVWLRNLTCPKFNPQFKKSLVMVKLTAGHVQCLGRVLKLSDNQYIQWMISLTQHSKMLHKMYQLLTQISSFATHSIRCANFGIHQVRILVFESVQCLKVYLLRTFKVPCNVVSPGPNFIELLKHKILLKQTILA